MLQDGGIFEVGMDLGLRRTRAGRHEILSMAIPGGCVSFKGGFVGDIASHGGSVFRLFSLKAWP